MKATQFIGGMVSHRLIDMIKLFVFVVIVQLVQGCAHMDFFADSPELLLQKAEQAYRQGNFNQSRRLTEKGLAYAGQFNDLNRIAHFYELRSRIEQAGGRFDQSLTHAQDCFKLSEQINNKVLRTKCLIALAASHRSKGDYSRSQHFLDKTAVQINALSDSRLSIHYRLALGALKQARGEFEASLVDYISALTQAKNIQDEYQQARSLNNLGGVYRQMAAYSKADEYYRQALSLRLSIGDKAGQASTYANLCNLYGQLRDWKPAIRFCRRAIRIAQRIGATARQANGLNSLAAIYRRLGELDKAFQAYQQSAELKRIIGDQAGLARSLNNLGEIKLADNRHNDALGYFEQALVIKQAITDGSEQATTLTNMGLAYESLNEHAKAQAAYNQALMIHTGIIKPESLWRIFANLSRLHGKLAQPELAVYFGKQAVASLQKIRKNLSGFSEQQRMTYLADKHRVYESLADLLIDLGRLYEAQQVLAMLKQDEYLDYIQRSSDDGSQLIDPVYSQAEQRLVDRYTEISRDLVTSHSEYQQLKSKKRLDALSADEQSRFDELSQQLSQAEQSFNSFIQALTAALKPQSDDELSKISEAGLNKLKSVKETLIQLDRQSALIHYLVTENRLRIILTLADSFVAPIHKDSEITRTELNRLIHNFRQALQSKNTEPQAAAKALYEVMLAPVRNELEDQGVSLLLIHLDEALRYIPVPALHDGSDYVANRFSTVIYTYEAESKLAFTPRQDWRIAGLGVSDKVSEDFSPLPAVEQELDGIVQEEDQTDDTGVLPGQIYINDKFTHDRLQFVVSEEQNPYQVVHVASHYQHYPGASTKSFLLTGTGEPLTLDTLAYGDFPMGQIDLFALSACETALDAENADGAEVDGLANTLLYRGVKSVIATLWKVADQSTAHFMEDFYQTRQSLTLGKAKALQRVQQKFIAGEIKALSTGDDRGAVPVDGGTQSGEATGDYSHPYYWAPFILMGNFL